ncbi:hypothetical protein ENUP19_0161G0037 [Entamoeba nuttalli]|uniref:Uncharacterized protein n=1 Tax=Entamoeba nuttalli TaxID=412467 RepID=A0ABQ0DLP3_9EUKA
MAAEQQTTPAVMWPFYIEDETDFSTLGIISFLLSIVSFIYKSRVTVMAALIFFVLSIPHKQKVDLQISALIMSGFPLLIALAFAYMFTPDSYA